MKGLGSQSLKKTLYEDNQRRVLQEDQPPWHVPVTLAQAYASPARTWHCPGKSTTFCQHRRWLPSPEFVLRAEKHRHQQTALWRQQQATWAKLQKVYGASPEPDAWKADGRHVFCVILSSPYCWLLTPTLEPADSSWNDIYLLPI